MDASQLWETTLNPETRILKQVAIEDARMASEVTEMLMGTDVPPRKAFIYEHATDADLDKDIVDFVPNFDETEKEPGVLPARIPSSCIS